MKLELTQKIVNSIALPKDRNDDVVWDTVIENFGMRMRRRSDGVRRVFICQYRVFGRSRRVTVGQAAKLTLAEARAAAKKVLAKVSLGGDPQGDKAAKRAQAGRTFGAAVELYLAAKAVAVRPATLRGIRLYLTGPYFKPLRGAPLAEIARADIAGRLNAIARDHGPGAVFTARRALSAFLSWSMQEGWLEANPVVGTRRPAAAPSRDRVLSDLELGEVWRAAGGDDYGRIIRLLILLGARRSEIGGMKWDELDLDAGIWTLPAARSKNHRSHTLPLSPAALEIIKATPRNGREFLFGERGAAGFATWSRCKRALDQRLGDKVAPWRLHDLRRTVSTRMHDDLGIAPHIVEAVLNHHDGHKAGVAGVYNRASYQTAVKIALTRWSEHVAALAAGRKSNILPLKHA